MANTVGILGTDIHHHTASRDAPSRSKRLMLITIIWKHRIVHHLSTGCTSSIYIITACAASLTLESSWLANFLITSAIPEFTSSSRRLAESIKI